MKAVRVHQAGGPEVLRYEDIDKPEPGVGEALVKIEAIGVNFIDIYKRTGQYKENLPFVDGEEAAGTVEAIGPGVSEIKVGDRVAYATHQGAYAEYAVVPAWKLAWVPQDITFRQAASVMLQGMTAHYLTTSTYPVQQGDIVLVHAAAGGTGQLVVQIAKLRGATVIGTVSTEEKAQIARAAGADHVINYTQSDFEEEVKRITEGKGVSAVYDSVGKDTFEKSINCLKTRGYMVLFGQSSGAVSPVDPQTLNAKGSLFLTRPKLANHMMTRQEIVLRTADLFTWMDHDQLKVSIDKTFPLDEAAEAHRYLEGRQSKGKVVLLP